MHAMKNLIPVISLCLLLNSNVQAQQRPDYNGLENGYPRVNLNNSRKEEIIKLTKNEDWAKDVLRKLKEKTDFHADNNPDWLSSRLMMHWNSKAQQVFIKGEFYDHSGGDTCSVPTGMFSVARSHCTFYCRSILE